MTDQTTILVPIRYPLTEESSRTLAAAGRLAHELAPADLRVLHVNLFQRGDNTRTADLTEAISSTLDDVEASVTTRQGFLVEEVILEEATQIGADVIVVGTSHRPIWQRFLRRLLRSAPEIAPYLLEHTSDETEIMEIDTAADVPVAKSV